MEVTQFFSFFAITPTSFYLSWEFTWINFLAQGHEEKKEARHMPIYPLKVFNDSTKFFFRPVLQVIVENKQQFLEGSPICLRDCEFS